VTGQCASRSSERCFHRIAHGRVLRPYNPRVHQDIIPVELGFYRERMIGAGDEIDRLRIERFNLQLRIIVLLT
jgi:hypothetical protein